MANILLEDFPVVVSGRVTLLRAALEVQGDTLTKLVNAGAALFAFEETDRPAVAGAIRNWKASGSPDGQLASQLHASGAFDAEAPTPPTPFEPTPTVALHGFTATAFYQGTAGDLRGEVGGFAVSAVIRQRAFPLAQGTIVGNHRIFQNDGGWWIGIDGNRWKFGIGQASDGSVPDNFGGPEAALTAYQGRLLSRLFVVTLNYDGTTATLYVNGQDVATLTPTGGFQPADAGLTPYVGRNANTGAQTPATGSGFVGFGYNASALTLDNVLAHYRACLDADGFADDTGAGAFTSAYTAPQDGGSIATLVDAQGVAGDLVLTGAITAESLLPKW